MQPTNRHFVTALFIFIALSAANCGGGGGSGSSSSHAPSISNLYIDPSSAIQNQETIVYYYFDVLDNGGDLSSMTVTVFDAQGLPLGSLTEPIQGASGITSGYIYGAFYADTTVVGNYTFEFYVTDSVGSDSNNLTGTFTVVPPATLVSIAVTPINPSIVKGATQQFTATGTYSDNTSLDITAQATWTSSDETMAAIDNTGLATGKGAGSSTITAALGGVSGSTSIRVVPGFMPAVNYPDFSTNIYLGNTAVGDLNGDGRNDVAVQESFGMHILIYYQNASGALDTPQAITTDLKLRGIAIGDVNNDGFADLIESGNSTTAASGLLGRIYVYKQDDTTHTLSTPQQYTLSTNNVGPLAIADLNGDGLLDVVAAGEGSGTNGVVSFLYQAGGGVLGPEVIYTSVSVVVNGELHVADMNNDTRNDIVLQSGAKQLAIIKQISPGAFSSSPDFYAIQTSYWSYFRSFALGDLNGDGRNDLIVNDPGNSGYLNIFIQDMGGILTGPTLRTISYSARDEVHIADLDGDELNDLILLSYGSSILILYQSVDHSFQDMLNYYLPTYSSGGTPIHEALSVGDVTGDGLLDIVASWSNEGIFVLPLVP